MDLYLNYTKDIYKSIIKDKDPNWKNKDKILIDIS
jgi:hypothetical protein